MKIGIIGAGNIGGTVGGLWSAAGHEVMFGARRRQPLEKLQELLGDSVLVGSPAEAAAFGRVVLFAAPFAAWLATAHDLAETLAGKLVIDAANPFPERDGMVVKEMIRRGQGAGSFTQALLPRSRVTKAFNTVFWKDLRDQAGRPPPRLAIPLVGDDEEGLALSERLITDAGFDVVRAGRLEHSRRVDPGSPVYARSLSARELEAALTQSR